MTNPLFPLPARRVGYILLRNELTAAPDGGVPQRRDGTVYEVLRVHGGHPVFLNEHIVRMRNSAELSSLAFPPESEWYTPLMQLCQMQEGTQNLQLMLLEDGTLEAHFIESHYPSQEQIDRGVEVGVIDGERPCPHAKRAGHSVREKADQMLRETRLFEVLLRNKYREITEGSRSNVLFIKNERLVTPPLAAVLPGITLAKVKEAAAQLGVEIEERAVLSDDLHTHTAAAILGTSPGVLPIRTLHVDGSSIPLNGKAPILRELLETYGLLMRAPFPSK